MSKAIKDYVKFNVLGIEEDLVSEEDKKLINKLKQIKYILSKSNKKYMLEQYSLKTQINIFNNLKLRQGNKCRITFLNSKKSPVEILEVKQVKDKLLLECIFCKTRRKFNMWLSTFLNEFESKNICKLRPEGFVNNYLITVSDYIVKINKALAKIYNKYNKTYDDTENQLRTAYENELAKYPKIEKEAKAVRYQMTTQEALEKAKAFKGLERTKDYWNTRISQEEKDSLLKWISENIYSIRVYGLLDGQSGNTLLNEYSDVGDVKIRPVKTNEEGKVTSQDSIVAHISFKQVENAPIDILKKVVSTKGRNENIFYNNRLNDKNLALFLLSEYHDKGFKAGVRNLYKEIKTA